MVGVVLTTSTVYAYSLETPVTGTINGTSDTSSVKLSYDNYTITTYEVDGVTKYQYEADCYLTWNSALNSRRYLSGIFYSGLTISTNSVNTSIKIHDVTYNGNGNLIVQYINGGYIYFARRFDNNLTNNGTTDIIQFKVTFRREDYLTPYIDTLELTSGNRYAFTASANGNDDTALAKAIADGINESNDIDRILTYLALISEDADLMSQVLSQVTDVNSKMSTVLTYLATIDNYNMLQRDYLNAIVFSLTGELDWKSMTATDIVSAFQEYWKDIIKSALDGYESEADQASEAMSEAGSELASVAEDMEIETSAPEEVGQVVDANVINRMTQVQGKTSTLFSWVRYNGVGAHVTMLLLIVFSLAIVSYILFGGK